MREHGTNQLSILMGRGYPRLCNNRIKQSEGMPIHPHGGRWWKAGLPRGDRCRRGTRGTRARGGETTRSGGGVGDGLEVWKDSENSRRHSSAPRACKFARIDPGREERGGKGRDSASERADHRRFTENAGAREERVKYLTDAATKRNKQQTSKQKPASAVSAAPARASRARRHDFRIPGLSSPLRGMQWREAKGVRGCQLHVMFLNPRSDNRLHVQRGADIRVNAATWSM